jgi:hypothetical protein
MSVTSIFVCIKEYKDEYGFIYKVGSKYTLNKFKNYIYRRTPGAGPFGTLAEADLPNDSFLEISKNREDKLNNILQ